MRLASLRAQLRPGNGLAIGLVILSSLLYSLGYALSKQLIQAWHFNAMQLFVLRSILVLAGISAMPLVGARPPSLARVLSPPHPWLQRLTALTLVISAVLATIGYGYLPVTTATAFSFLAPLLATAMAAVFLREKVSVQRWIAIAVGFAGVIVIVHPGGRNQGQSAHLIGIVAAFGSATLYAMQQMLIRRARDSMTTMDVMAQAAVVGLVLLVWFMPFVWRPVPTSALLLIVAAAATQTGGLLTIAAAIRIGQISQLAPWQYGGMVWAMLLDLFMFGHTPGLVALIGAAMIVAGGLLSQFRLQGFSRLVRMRS
ncbi:DMT family transporter [Acidisoma cellulosilytica]|uniref:DMT family transporter n=1 Tax=Acidisoma cellulosilyticum TaxID=2802395 RepID=A0A963Z002_9PROT|nr:DMT family transporter [Acidisoma cellulosilyticum]MCB8879323.1 DMT family transporter [Acidisoma cellulosilyticum]